MKQLTLQKREWKIKTASVYSGDLEELLKKQVAQFDISDNGRNMDMDGTPNSPTSPSISSSGSSKNAEMAQMMEVMKQMLVSQQETSAQLLRQSSRSRVRTPETPVRAPQENAPPSGNPRAKKASKARDSEDVSDAVDVGIARAEIPVLPQDDDA